MSYLGVKYLEALNIRLISLIDYRNITLIFNNQEAKLILELRVFTYKNKKEASCFTEHRITKQCLAA